MPASPRRYARVLARRKRYFHQPPIAEPVGEGFTYLTPAQLRLSPGSTASVKPVSSPQQARGGSLPGHAPSLRAWPALPSLPAGISVVASESTRFDYRIPAPEVTAARRGS